MSDKQPNEALRTDRSIIVQSPFMWSVSRTEKVVVGKADDVPFIKVLGAVAGLKEDLASFDPEVVVPDKHIRVSMAKIYPYNDGTAEHEIQAGANYFDSSMGVVAISVTCLVAGPVATPPEELGYSALNRNFTPHSFPNR